MRGSNCYESGLCFWLTQKVNKIEWSCETSPNGQSGVAQKPSLVYKRTSPMVKDIKVGDWDNLFSPHLNPRPGVCLMLLLVEHWGITATPQPIINNNPLPLTREEEKKRLAMCLSCQRGIQSQNRTSMVVCFHLICLFGLSFVLFWDSISLCSSGWHRTQDHCASASWVSEFKCVSQWLIHNLLWKPHS